MSSNKKMNEILSHIQSDRNVRKMKKYIQHGSVSTFDHCESVARLCYAINRRFSLHADLEVLLTGAMLHDFYLYDWHCRDNGGHRFHGFRHAMTACRNAERYMNIDRRTSDVIYSHMWPLNPERIPASKEAWIVCIADKVVSLHETLFKRS